MPFHRPITLGAIRLYQLLISGARGGSCPMHPHCSAYGYQAFSTHHPLLAFMMTADRLHRCGHDSDKYPIVHTADGIRLQDPVPGTSAGCPLPPVPCIRSSLLASAGISYATEEDEKIFSFARQLQRDGDAERALTEYLRLLSYYPDSPLRAGVLVEVGHCYFQSGRLLDVLRWQDEIDVGVLSLDQREALMELTAFSYLKLDNQTSARTVLRRLTDSSVPERGARSRMLLGFSLAEDRQWTEANREFDAVPAESPHAEAARRCAALALKGLELHHKRPGLAGILAVIPGLGYLYDGYPKTAFSAFLVNALFIGGTWEAFDQGNESLGAFLGLLSFGWYSGNIYGSISSARRMNDKIHRDHLARFDLGVEY